MIFRLRTFGKFAAAFWTLPVLCATITGTVQLSDSSDPDVKRNNFSGVSVWLEPVAGGAPATKPAVVTMSQKNKQFIPHVLAIPVGSTVDFPNFDGIFHNAFSNFSGQLFDVGLYAPGTSQKVTFRREGVVRVFCNIHPTMSAVIVVAKTPYVAVSNRSGAFTLGDVQPGEYKLRIFYERATESTLKSLERTITVGAEALPLPPLAISESGYLQVPHKNKHGKDYPPVVVDTPMYSGRRP